MQLLICASCLSLLMLMSYRLIILWHKQLMTLHQKCDRTLPIYLALDMLQKDIMQAEQIEKLSTEQVQLTSPYKTVVWVYTQDKLVRRVLTYDAKSRRWKKPSSSLLVQHVTVVFAPLKHAIASSADQAIRGVQVTVKQDAQTIIYKGYMRNGNYVIAA